MSLPLVGIRSSQPTFPPSVSRQAYTFISYQGRSPSSSSLLASQAPVLEPLIASGDFCTQGDA